MEIAGATYSSAHMRERDKILEEKHQKELSVLQRRIEKLRWANDDTLKQLFDTQHRALRLANSLGFNDIFQAQVYIDTAEHEVPYKECFEKVGFLEARLDSVFFEMEELKMGLLLAEKEKEELKAKLEASGKKELDSDTTFTLEKGSESLQVELSELKKRYDKLSDKIERAKERYKSDYKKWREFKKWLFTEDDVDKKENGRSKKCSHSSVVRKKRKLREMGLDVDSFVDGESMSKQRHGNDSRRRRTFISFTLSEVDYPPPLGGTTNPLSDKENQGSPISARKKGPSHAFSSPATPLSLAMSVLNSPAAGSVDPSCTLKNPSVESKPPGNSSKAFMPSYSPSIFLNPTSSVVAPSSIITYKPVPVCVPSVKQEPQPTPSRRVVEKKFKNDKFNDEIVPNSSDTEIDPQAVQSVQRGFKIPELPQRKQFSPPNSSDTEEDTQSSWLQQHVTSLATPVSLPRPSKAKPEGNAEKCKGEPPRKIRRVDAIATPKASGRRTIQSSTGTSKLHRHESPKSTASEQIDKVQLEGLNNGKEVELDSTPVNNRSSVQGKMGTEHYSTLKGRGRYAAEINSAKKTINSTYAIDSSRNGGFDFQFDEVVRRKVDRKKMDAGDCECCRGYYEAVGPLPTALQQPLWRSPPKTEVKKKLANCGTHKRHVSDTLGLKGSNQGTKKSTRISKELNGFSDESQLGLEEARHRQIEDHKKVISRHRHHWARANTPPGYWNIGFPDTQEVENINEKAKEMHKRKREDVERSVERGDGRYRKR
ncbi:hypothetical protein AX17_007503 [Amanita inopinata Kibby_2008]|nr:hypothetical protein AX17_007503 [Amanita inopinata Kibby_2008]